MRLLCCFRKRAVLAFGAVTLSASAAAVVACGRSGDPATIILQPDTGATPLPRDGSLVPTEAGARLGTLRVVHAAVGLPALDFCTRTGPQDLYAGPFLGGGRSRDGGIAAEAGDGDAGDAQASDASDARDATANGPDGAAVGVSFLTASQYVSVEGSGTVEIAMVAAGSGSCAQPLAVGTITLEPGKLKTAVVHLTGPLSPDAGNADSGTATADAGPTDAGADAGRAAAGVAAFDDAPDVFPNRATLRLIYASAGVKPLTATLYATRTTTLGTLAPLSALRAESDAAPVDTLGYASVDPGPPPTTLGLRDEGAPSPSLSAQADLGLTGGSLHTAFVVRDGDKSAILYCNDVNTVGPRTQCFVLAFP
ncbi:MAG: hypothetical protein IPF92_22965 [Myxococcales bacterium]|nr:hypothetical protein [Myxococcales bacterium]MBL0194703.1 hypothetical protein [Myxococcales bacterium]